MGYVVLSLSLSFSSYMIDRSTVTNINRFLRTLEYSFDEARAHSIFSSEMINMVKQARRRKVENKARERQRVQGEARSYRRL